jgi:hypothetical protein
MNADILGLTALSVVVSAKPPASLSDDSAQDLRKPMFCGPDFLDCLATLCHGLFVQWHDG